MATCSRCGLSMSSERPHQPSFCIADLRRTLDDRIAMLGKVQDQNVALNARVKELEATVAALRKFADDPARLAEEGVI